jgi:hypothetical protein
MSGSVSREAALDLKFSRGKISEGKPPDNNGSVWQVGGTLSKPQAGAEAPEPTQASGR